MAIDHLVNELKQMYFGATDGEKAVSIHLFGIKFAEQLSGASLREIAVRAGVDESYATEIRKGMNLAKYVSVKQ